MGLSGRKEKIIQAVVNSYINSCEPISSSEIRDKHLPSLSTATIRNELAALEEMGYLVQPHTSSGRIPTAEAYRLYVEKLMPKRKLTRAELKTVKRYFGHKIMEIDDILKSTAKVISEITNLTSVAYAENLEEATIENIKIVKISDSTALIIIVTNFGILKDTTVSIGKDSNDEYFTTASKFISEAFAGHTIGDAVRPSKIIREVKLEYQQVFNTVLKILKGYSADEMVSDIVLEGSAKLLEQPEYANVSKAKAMLELLDAKDELVPVLRNNDKMNLSVTIGKDNEIRQGMPECAIVTANYSVNGIKVGTAGVIGPIRMDYSKVFSVLDYISKTINLLPEGESQIDDDTSEEQQD